jgi:predicted dehydrogenase
MSGEFGIGIVGAGSIARGGHIPGYLSIPDRCRVVAIADIEIGRAKKLAAEFDIPYVFNSHEKLLEVDEVDAVSVCTPPSAHAPATIEALKSGRHVMTEKPMAVDLTAARDMVAAAHTAGRVLAVDFQTRFIAQAQAMKQFIDSGELGNIYFARASYVRQRGIPARGAFHSKEKSGGGALMDIGVHVLDACLWLMGFPTAVSASGSVFRELVTQENVFNPMGQWDRATSDVEESAVGLIKFASGAAMTLECAWALNVASTKFGIDLAGNSGGGQVQFEEAKHGDPGTSPLAVFKDNGRMLLDWTPNPGAPPRDLPTPHTLSMQNFVTAATEGSDPLVTGDQGLVISTIVDALYRSAASGREVIIEP